MTMSALKAHPKVYWIWNHRIWCLENLPSGPGIENSDNFTAWKQSAWEKELFVVEKMLDADPRNCEIPLYVSLLTYFDVLCLFVSSCLGLQTIYFIWHTCTSVRIYRVVIYFSKNWGQLFQFLCLASAFKDVGIFVEKWQAR